MSKYSLIALDVDGTALNDDKYLLPGTVRAVNDALESGVEVIFCSGRSPAEMREYFASFPKMRYFVGECGGLIYDLKNEKPLFCARFDFVRACECVPFRVFVVVVFCCLVLFAPLWSHTYSTLVQEEAEAKK